MGPMNLKTIKAIAFAVVVAVIAAGCYTYTVELGPFAPSLELSPERFYAIKAEIERTPDPIIVFGDSIVQGAPLPNTICGKPVVNAGVVGAAIGYVDRYANKLMGSSHPKLIVLAIGINDATAADREANFRSHYYKTVAWLSQRAPVEVATITPVRSGVLSTFYDAAFVPIFNVVIKETPNVTAVIDLNQPLSAANWTTDGIHFGPEGYSRWTKAMIEGISAALGCAK
jgi:hypothetical protein